MPVFVPTLDSVTTGAPMTFTRIAVTVHCAGTQGIGVAGGVVNGHPAMSTVHACVTTSAPPAFTRVFYGMIFAWPPCAQRMVAATVASGAPIR